LRRFTRASMDVEPEWRRPSDTLTTGHPKGAPRVGR
jgi:hypothetical protein